MERGTAKTVLYLVVGAGALYLLYQLWQKLSTAVPNLTNPATTALANWYVQLTAQGSPIPQGFILFPDGTSVSSAVLNIAMVPNTNSATFQYLGQSYYLNSPHDENGNWAASTSLGG